MATENEATTLQQYHSRRAGRLEAAFFGTVLPDHVHAWAAIGYRRQGDLDMAEFDRLISEDVAAHGLPTTLDAFVLHHNRLIEARAKFFRESYRMIALLGAGGFSRVVRSERLLDGKMVALKCSEKQFDKGRTLELLESEMSIWGKDALRHPGLVQLYGTYELPETIVLVTELCEGGCLLDQLELVETMNEASVRQIGAQVISAILHLHQVARISHRDIKPENVLCTHTDPHVNGRVLLSDFGFAAELQGGLTKLVGTPEYLAPELVTSFRKRRASIQQGVAVPVESVYDERVDLWSLGVLLYELFTGFPPFNSEDDEELYVATAWDPNPHPRREPWQPIGGQAIGPQRGVPRRKEQRAGRSFLVADRRGAARHVSQASIVGDNGVALDFPDVPFASCSQQCVALLRQLLEREPERRASGDALRTLADEWLESVVPTHEVFSTRPRHATATSIARGRNLKTTGLATRACFRFALEGRQGAARCIQERVRARHNGGEGCGDDVREGDA